MLIEFPDEMPDANDTVVRDQLDHIMNDITKKYYGFTLCLCPDCSNVLVFYDDKPIPCPCCPESQDYPIDSNECPDLFF